MMSNEKPSDGHMVQKRKTLGLVRVKACPRCSGDLSIERDVFGIYIECIQCGATWTKNDLKLTAPPNADTLNAAAVKPQPADTSME
jgi:ribosomal protein L37AE/L43A